MDPRTILRLEGATVFAVALGSYLALDGSPWLLALLALAPDLALVAYLFGPEIGSRGYNAAHTHVGPLALGATGAWVDARVAVLAALVWAAHVGADRALGLGLKYPTGFWDTHLSKRAERA